MVDHDDGGHDLVSDLLDLRGKGIDGVDSVPSVQFEESLRRLISELSHDEMIFMGFQNMVIPRSTA